MPSIDELLTAKLCENGYYLWTKSWTAVVSRILARAVLASFDPGSGRFVRPLPSINDALWRVGTMDAASDVGFL